MGVLGQVKRLLVRGLCFCLPPALLWAGAMARSGEVTRLDTVIEKQLRDHSVIYGPTYSENNHYYRSAFARAVQPEVLVIGDSRISLVRSWFFEDAEKVYNACWGAITPLELVQFLEGQQGGSIDTVVFALNHFDYNTNYNSLTQEYTEDAAYTSAAPGTEVDWFWSAQGLILENWKNGKLSLLRLLTSPGNRLGTGAIYAENGVMTDGSFYSGIDYATVAAAEDTAALFAGMVGQINAGSGRFVFGDEVSPLALVQLEQALAYCRAQGIHVVAFLPPYAPSVNAALDGQRENYGYHYALPGALAPVFERYGFEFYDYTDPLPLGCDDSFFLDGIHGGDTVMVRMLLDMMARGSALGQLCSADALRALDAGRHENWLLLKDIEAYQARLPAYEGALERFGAGG